MITLGVDLAAQPKKTATCLVCWDGTSARVESLSTGAHDSDLYRLFKQACKIGIDAPFGWPRPFVRAIQRYATAKEWPTGEVRQLRYRRTDEVVIERVGIFPLVHRFRSSMTYSHAAWSSEGVADPGVRAMRRARSCRVNFHWKGEAICW